MVEEAPLCHRPAPPRSGVHMRRAPPFLCHHMEQLDVASLSGRKESLAVPLTGPRRSACRPTLHYPLALVLRLRVLQIVCGVCAMVMSGVASIEQGSLGLGLPAGALSVLAAAVSIHTSRGWSVATSGAGACAGAVAVLWAAAGCLLLALLVQCCRTILDPPGLDHGDEGPSEELPSPRDLVVVAAVQAVLAAATLLSAALCARIDRAT